MLKLRLKTGVCGYRLDEVLPEVTISGQLNVLSEGEASDNEAPTRMSALGRTEHGGD